MPIFVDVIVPSPHQSDLFERESFLILKVTLLDNKFAAVKFIGHVVNEGTTQFAHLPPMSLVYPAAVHIFWPTIKSTETPIGSIDIFNISPLSSAFLVPSYLSHHAPILTVNDGMVLFGIVIKILSCEIGN